MNLIISTNASLILKAAAKEPSIQILYDKACPICHYHPSKLSKHNDTIQVINARTISALFKKATQQDHDINKGTVIYFDEQLQNRSESDYLLTKHSKGLLINHLCRWRNIAKIAYPVFVFIKRFILQFKRNFHDQR